MGAANVAKSQNRNWTMKSWVGTHIRCVMNPNVSEGANLINPVHSGTPRRIGAENLATHPQAQRIDLDSIGGTKEQWKVQFAALGAG